jgi:hypothetical protein
MAFFGAKQGEFCSHSQNAKGEKFNAVAAQKKP